MKDKTNTDSIEELKNAQQKASDTNAAAGAVENPPQEAAVELIETPESVRAEMMDRILRLQADFDNHRRRTRQEQSELGAYVTQNIIKELLPVVDNFERALNSRPTEDPSGFGAGVEMICRQLYSVLEKQGITVVETVGTMFDPAKHEAILKDEDSDLPDGTVVEELQKGYAISGKILRPALVRVAGK